MGVTGLWRLVEPAGKPVPVETLENKVLAVDISIWLHQMVKGYQDAKGAPLPNAHLIGLFQRLCKLLYFRIKPVFVFDGGFPDLKRETIAKRQDHKTKYQSESERLKRELALLLSKKTAIGNLLGNQTSPKKPSNNINNDDLFKLPALPERDEESESESEDEQNSSGSIIDVHSIDVNSENFKNLPVKEKYDLLMELKETRKMNSWGKLHELPKKSDNFSDFQMQRLLKRRKVQECIQETEKEMGSCGMSLNELESLLNEEGIDTKLNSLPGRIASNNTTRFLLINNVKQALADAKKTELKKQASINKNEGKPEETEPIKKDELDEDLQKAIKMSLECDDENDDLEAAEGSKIDDSWTSFVTESDYSSSDSEEGDGFGQPDMSSAKNYILQYSDFTSKAIDQIIAPKNKKKGKQVKESIREMDKKAVATNNVDLSSSEDEIENLEKSDLVKIDQQVILDETQSSVIFIENLEHNVLEVSSSFEDETTGSEKKKKVQDVLQKSDIESDSSDDDFEEVKEPEIIQKSVVQLTLNSLKESIDDDIFADVFAPKVEQDHKKADEDNPALKDSKFESFNGEKCEKNIDTDKEVKNDIKELKDTHEEQKQTNANENRNMETEIKENTKNANTNIVQKSETNNVKSGPSVSTKELSKEELSTMVKEIEDQEEVLLQEKGKLDRVGRNITEEMTKEAQELLQIFGIPYIVAPMEAEAQCAFLESVKLTDGTITDDSDIWLFGGRTVYKNFFNQKKHVLQFLADRIEKSFNLTREQLILLALLVGSDYTTGVAGVGPVTALEILASFPFKKQFHKEEASKENYAEIVTGLKQFKQWIKAGKRTDNISLKKKLKNVNITDDFPSVRVVQAYLEPNVEKSEEKFSWGDIDITILRDYTRSKFGWSQSKLDEIINPVLKRILERKSQKSVYDFFKRKVEFQSLEDQMSKRVKAAVQRMGPDVPEGAIVTEEVKTKNVRKRKTKDGLEKPGSSKNKKAKTGDIDVLNEHAITVVSKTIEGKSQIEINIPKSDRFQEIIPQREKDKHLLSNKLKAIEVFRKTKIDTKRKHNKRKVILPKEKAELSESSDTD